MNDDPSVCFSGVGAFAVDPFRSNCPCLLLMNDVAVLFPFHLLHYQATLNSLCFTFLDCKVNKTMHFSIVKRKNACINFQERL